jgi:hypothetical protein
MRRRAGPPLLVRSPADAGVYSLRRRRRPLMSEYAGKQFVGIDLHRRRSVIVRTDDAGEVLETVRILNDMDRLNTVLSRAAEPRSVRRWCWRPPWLVSGGRHAAGRWRPGALGASVGCEGVRVPAGEQRRPRCHRSGGSVAARSAAGGVDRSTGHRGSCASWSGNGPSWSAYGHSARPRCTRFRSLTTTGTPHLASMRRYLWVAYQALCHPLCRKISWGEKRR